MNLLSRIPLAAGLGAASLLILLAPAAHAQAANALSVDYEIAAVSDYRYRGYSLTDEKPALQGGATVSSPSGWYGSVWGSTIAEYGVGADGDGAEVEIDLAVGRSITAGAYTFDVGVAAYGYPDGTDVSFLEAPVSVSRAVGAWTWTVGGAYAPDQTALGGDDNGYLYGAVAWAPAQGPWTVSAQVGREEGAFAPTGKWDWQAGIERRLGPVTLSAAYVDTDAAGVKGALVAALKAAF